MKSKRSIDIVLSEDSTEKFQAVCSFSTSVLSRRNSSSSSSNYLHNKLDWGKCFICGKETKDKLRCSISTRSADAKKSYDDLAGRIKAFESIHMLPVELEIKKLEDGVELGQSLLIHKAKFHKICKLKFNKKALELAQKAAENFEISTEIPNLEKKKRLSGR